MNIQHPASSIQNPVPDQHPASSIQHQVPRIAVIGAGISGLAAAHRITELLPHAKLTLFEARGRLGGVIETVPRDRFLIERSADSFITRLPWAVELCRRLGLEDDLLPTDESRRRAMVVRDARLLPVPDGFFVMSPRQIWPMLTTPVLSWRGKLRLLAEPFVPPRQTLETERRSDSLADESVESFACRRLGREAFERLVQPLMAGIYTADPAKLSMAATMPEFLRLEHQYGSLLRATLSQRNTDVPASGARYGLFVAPRTGMETIIDAIKSRLPVGSIRLNARVTKIEPSANEGWTLTISGQSNQARYDVIIIALPAFAAGELLKDANAALAAELSSIPYASCAVVSVALRASQLRQPLESFGFVVPKVERRRIVAASFASAKFPGRAPQDAVLIRLFIGGALQPELAALDDDDLNRLAVDELSDLVGLTGEPLWFDIARWPRSMPQYHVGHLQRVERIERLANQLPRLALAGNAFRGVGIPQCIHSGEVAAERIAQQIGALSK